MPGEQNHSRVMINMQEGDLVLFLAEDKKDLQNEKEMIKLVDIIECISSIVKSLRC